MVNLATDTQVDTLFYIMCLRENSSKATHIYTVSITLFKVLCEIFQDTQYYPCDRHYIYMYTQTCIHNGMEMRRNLFVDLWCTKKIDIGDFFLSI